MELLAEWVAIRRIIFGIELESILDKETTRDDFVLCESSIILGFTLYKENKGYYWMHYERLESHNGIIERRRNP